MIPEGRLFEFLLVAVLALIVVGPKDLPPLLRKLGQFMAKLRGMAAEFRASFDEMARQSELDELRKEVEALRQGQIADIAARATGHEEIAATFDEIHQGLSDVGVQLHPPMSYQYVETPADPLPAAAAPKPRAKAPRKTASKAIPARPAPKPPARKAAAPRPAPAKPTRAKPATARRPAVPRRKSPGPKS